MKGAVALVAPALLPIAAGVGAEEYAAGFQGRLQFLEYPRQGLAGNMEQHGVGEHAVEMRGRQIEFEEILLQHVAAAVGARHRGQPLCALKTGGVVAEFLESFEVTSWTAPEVEQLKRRGCLDVVQQRGDVLAHVMVARALPELVCVMLVMRQRPGGYVFDSFGVHGHSRSCYSISRRVLNDQNPHGLIRLTASGFL